MLEGKSIRLRVIEKEDLRAVAEWVSNPLFMGEYQELKQETVAELEKMYDRVIPEGKWFFIIKKDGGKIGYVTYYPVSEGTHTEVGYMVVPDERNKGYGTEALKIIVDYVFLLKDRVRIQAITDAENLASRKILEKAGFKLEGTIRKSYFNRGIWRDEGIYSILREEWKEPKILAKTVSPS